MRALFTKVISIIVVVALAYFGNKMVQTHLGKAAVGDLSFNVHSLDDAIELAAKTNKLILADYSAIWCPSCRKLDTNVFGNDAVAAEIDKGYIYARLDYDTPEGQAFAKAHGLVGFPRVLVLNQNAEKLIEMPLTFDPITYQLNLSRALTQFSNAPLN